MNPATPQSVLHNDPGLGPGVMLAQQPRPCRRTAPATTAESQRSTGFEPVQGGAGHARAQLAAGRRLHRDVGAASALHPHGWRRQQKSRNAHGAAWSARSTTPKTAGDSGVMTPEHFIFIPGMSPDRSRDRLCLRHARGAGRDEQGEEAREGVVEMLAFRPLRRAEGPDRDRPALRRRSASSPSPPSATARRASHATCSRRPTRSGSSTPPCPPEYGGAGMGELENAMITEQLAYGCTGIQTSMLANTLALTPIKLAGNEEQKKKYLGMLTAEPLFASYCTTEPSGGSDVAGMQTRFEQHGDDYVITGAEVVDHQRHLAELLRRVRHRRTPAKTPQGHRRLHRRPRHARAEGRQARGQARPARQRHRAVSTSKRSRSRRRTSSPPRARASSSRWRPSTRRAPTSAPWRPASCSAASTRAVAYAKERVSLRRADHRAPAGRRR